MNKFNILVFSIILGISIYFLFQLVENQVYLYEWKIANETFSNRYYQLEHYQSLSSKLQNNELFFFDYAQRLAFFKKWKEDLHLSSEKIELISNLSLKENFYLPYCICVVSKFPLTEQSKILIKSMVNIAFKDFDINEDKPKENKHDIENLVVDNYESFESDNDKNIKVSNLNKIKSNNCSDNFINNLNKRAQILFDFLKHLTYEVPYPTNKELKSKKLKLYLPFCESPIEIIPNKYPEMPLLAYSLDILYDFFSTENIVIIYHLILLEQKILFISKSASTLSKILECFKSVIYPFIWCNSFVSVLSEDLLKFLQCIIPFMMGIEDSLFIQGKEFLENNEDVYIVYIDKNSIESYHKPKKITKKILK